MTSSESTKKVHTNADNTHVMVDGSVRIASGVYIHPSAVIGAGVSLGEGVSVREHSSVGRETIIGAWTFVAEHVTIGEGVIIGTQCSLRRGVTLDPTLEPGDLGTIIGNYCIIYPRAHIRTGVSLGHHVRVGPMATLPEYWQIPPWYCVNDAQPYPLLVHNYDRD